MNAPQKQSKADSQKHKWCTVWHHKFREPNICKDIQTQADIPCQSWWKQKQSAPPVQRSTLLLQWSGNFDRSRLSSLTSTFLYHLTERQWSYSMRGWIWYMKLTTLSSLTAWSIVVCCKVDAVFWAPACERKKLWRKESANRKDLIVLTFFFFF